MNAYQIFTVYNYSQTHLVIAKNMGEAEKTFKEQYRHYEITGIKLISEYVIVGKSK